MEAVIIHEGEYLPFEPLASYVDIFDLYVGDVSILNETLANLYHTGLRKAYFLVELHKLERYRHLDRSFSFGKKDSHLELKVVGLNVDRMDVGPALRELFALVGQLPNFILMYSNTLLTVPLLECVEAHEQLAKANSKHCMTVLFVEDTKKRYVNLDDEAAVLHDERNELLFLGSNDVLKFDFEFLSSVKSDVTIRYDLYRPCVYLCTHSVVETFLEFFDQNSMGELIAGILTQEIKTQEIYVHTLKNDLSFPQYPAAVRVNTPRIYYNVYMDYISRFISSPKGATNLDKARNEVRYGPVITEGSQFTEDSAFTSPNQAQTHASSVSKSVLGANVKTGRGCKVLNSLLFGNVTLGNNCIVENSIVMNDVKVKDGAHLRPGSIVGPNCTVGTVDSVLKCADSPTKFHDLTAEDPSRDPNMNHNGLVLKEEGGKSKGGEKDEPKTFLWDVDPFLPKTLHRIGDEFYDFLQFKMPESDSDDSDYEGFEQEYSDEFPDSEFEPEETISADFKLELATMVEECLEDPRNLENKLLEIRSLRVAHNVAEEDVLRILFGAAITWVVQRGEEELAELVERCRFSDLLHSFSIKLPNHTYYEESLRVCLEMEKSERYYSLLSEALYRSEVLDFVGFQKWVLDRNLKDERLLSFAEWLESD